VDAAGIRPGCDELCSVCVDLGKFTRLAPKVAAISVIFSRMSFYVLFWLPGEDLSPPRERQILLLGTSAFPLLRAKWLHPVNKLVARAHSQNKTD
jgi:hypothetical protein